MTATVTPPHIVDKFDDLAPMSGDNLTRLTYGLLDIRKPPGQLWERVAETPSYAPAPLTARQDEGIVRAYAERDIRARGGNGHTPHEGCPQSSGIIRAGERIK